ncbi:MAG: RimK/LysX family protein [Wenzhouxiangellaceae bacterium]|nr:RimK/LysX family protein [Wenzhouxiangellaceae bacterium]
MKPRPLPNMIIGACEWVALPKLDVRALRARVDTGARTCALHASRIEPYVEKGVRRARFRIHTGHPHEDSWQQCTAPIVDVKRVRSSTGHDQERLTIRTDIVIGHERWAVDITLTNREQMTYRMLLGRDAMKNHALVYPAHTFLQGKPRINQPQD